MIQTSDGPSARPPTVQGIDALRIGSIRDCFSEVLFPGISASQTRAKYFVTVPRIFRDFERLPAEARFRRKLSMYLREQEGKCMEALVRNHQNDRQSGIIGESFAAKPGEVQRRHSQVYWAGLRRYGLIATRRSLAEFVREFAAPRQPLLNPFPGADEPDVEDGRINTPDYRDDWLDSLTIHLSEPEAAFLAKQISGAVPSSFIGTALSNAELRQRVVRLPAQSAFGELAADAALLSMLTDELRQTVEAASGFANLARGALIRYGYLTRQHQADGGQASEWEASWNDWRESMVRFPWRRWNPASLRRVTSKAGKVVPAHTLGFIEQWATEVRAGHSSTERLDGMVAERMADGGRLASSTKRLANASFSEGESPAGCGFVPEMNLRWDVARTIISDIDAGLSATQRT